MSKIERPKTSKKKSTRRSHLKLVEKEPEVPEIPDDSALTGAEVDPKYRTVAFVEQMIVEAEGVLHEKPERAKEMASIALRLASRLPNDSVARAWDLWASSCSALGSEGQAEGARILAGLYDPNQRFSPRPRARRPSTRRRD